MFAGGTFLKQSWVIPFVCLLCTCLTCVESLRCYECTESDVNSCGETFNRRNVSVTDCKNSIYTADARGTDEANYACMYLKETDLIGQISVYTRRCTAKNLNDTCESIVMKNQMISKNIRTDCRQCENDLCNSSGTIYGNYLLCFLSAYLLNKMS